MQQHAYLVCGVYSALAAVLKVGERERMSTVVPLVFDGVAHSLSEEEEARPAAISRPGLCGART